MFQLQFNSKVCIKQILYTIVNSVFLIISILCIIEFKLYEKFNNIMFTFYCIVLGLYLMINIMSIITSTIYLKRYNELVDNDSLDLIRQEISFNKIKIKSLIYVLFFIFDLILGIIFYTSGAVNNISITNTLLLIILTAVPFLFVFGMILTAILGIGMAVNEYCDYIMNQRYEHNNNVEIIDIHSRRRNQTLYNSNANTYNINIIVPLPGIVASQNIASISTPREKNCSICLDEQNNDEWVKLVCDHKYHKACVFKWFETHSTCPLCRQDILNLV